MDFALQHSYQSTYQPIWLYIYFQFVQIEAINFVHITSGWVWTISWKRIRTHTREHTSQK